MVDVDSVIHLAGRAHVKREKNSEALSKFRPVNVDASLVLAQQAAVAGVRRFIFISSIGVNGDQTFGEPFSESDLPHPRTPYAISKLEAEESITRVLAESATECVIIRPPLVYGRSPPGNLAILLRALSKRIPLPFRNVRNKRTLIALENLVDFIHVCMIHPLAANELFLVSDGADVSTSDLIESLAVGMGISPRLFSMSPAILQGVLRTLGRENIYAQLFGSLQVESSKCARLLNWQPPVTTFEALAEVGRAYRNERR
jgi:nucleoside-diphosphate-sugar epimerase